MSSDKSEVSKLLFLCLFTTLVHKDCTSHCALFFQAVSSKIKENVDRLPDDEIMQVQEHAASFPGKSCPLRIIKSEHIVHQVC